MTRKRNPRVDKLVRAALADLLETEVADPRLTLVSLTDVEVTPDHEVATVYWSSLDPALLAADPRRTGGDRLAEQHEIEEAFASATPRLRSLLGSRVRLRTTPELRFRPDPAVAQASRIDELLSRIEPTVPVPGAVPTSGEPVEDTSVESEPVADASVGDAAGEGGPARDRHLEDGTDADRAEPEA